MQTFIGFVLVMAMGYGIVHFCGVAFGWLRRLARLAVSRRTAQPIASAKPLGAATVSEQPNPTSSPSP